jgi:hypothetical protein
LIDFRGALSALQRESVEFVVVGGAAANVHGSARLTQDLDVVYSRRPENLERLVGALQPFAPYLRGAPPGLPFRWDVETLRRGLNFTLVTSLGEIDVLGEIAGGGGYDALARTSTRISVYGVECLCLNLEALIHVKRAAGRTKDLEAIAELEALLDERERRKGR